MMRLDLKSMLAAIRKWKSSLPASPDVQARSQIAGRSGSRKKPTPGRSRAFKRWDKNEDGVLTLEEYKAGLSNKSRADERFRNFDSNGDGKLSRGEFVK